MIGIPTKENYEFAFRCGGRRKRYVDGGSINQVASNAAIVEGPSHEQGGVPYGANAEVDQRIPAETAGIRRCACPAYSGESGCRRYGDHSGENPGYRC